MAAPPRARARVVPSSSGRAARRARSLPLSLMARLRSLLCCLLRWEQDGRAGMTVDY